MSVELDFELFVAVYTSVLLVYASIKDFQERAIEGTIWVILLISSIPINLIRLVLHWGNWPLILLAGISILFGLFIAITFGYYGLWGGADVLALISISIISPISLFMLRSTSIMNENDLLLIILPFSLIILMNAVLIQIPIPFVLALKNGINYIRNPQAYRIPLEHPLKKIFASFLGGPISISDLIRKHPWFYSIIENHSNFQKIEFPVPFIRNSSEALYRWQLFRTKWWSLSMPQIQFNSNILNKNKNQNWKFNFQLGLASEEEDLFRQRMILLEASQTRSYLWIQYSIPFLIPLTLGYIISILGFNLLLELIRLF